MAKKTTSRKTVKVIKKKVVKAPSKKKQAEMASAEQEIQFYPTKHILVASHELLNEEEVEALFIKFHVQPQSLPVIYISDPAIAGLPAKMGDIVKITRKSPTAGIAIFYRRVAYE